MEASRTSKSIKNITVALGFLAVNLILQFFCRKVFLDHLGAEVLGLNTTATNLLQFLNIAELGIGAAVGFSLYKPLYDHNEQAINEIVSLQGHLYRRIACIVIAGAVIMGCFFPLIFHKMKLPLWYAYASFGVLLLSALLSYFVNYKEILLTADQKEYKILYSYRSCMLARLIIQIVAVKYFSHPYIWWLAIEGGFALIAAWALNRMVHKTYPFLQTGISNVHELRQKYPTIVTKIKQVFFHKISTYVLQQTSPLIIYAFATLTLVAYYGNYIIIVTGVAVLLNALFNSIGAGVGNLIAEGDKPKIMHVFSELFSARFYICALASTMIFVLSPPFICLWLGPQYLLPQSTLLIIVITQFLSTSRNSVDSFINGYGMFQDVWAPIAEACLNLGLSVLFGFFWNLNGILIGAMTSIVLIIFIWKPYFLFRWGLKEPISIYIGIYLRHILSLGLSLLLFWSFHNVVRIDAASTTGNFMLYTLVMLAGYGLILFGCMAAFNKGMRWFTARMAGKIRSVLHKK